MKALENLDFSLPHADQVPYQRVTTERTISHAARDGDIPDLKRVVDEGMGIDSQYRQTHTCD